jgi:CBS domain-containing protein
MTDGRARGRRLGASLTGRELLACHADDLVGDLVQRMVERDVGRVPVLDEAGRLVGLVSRKDLLAVHAAMRAKAKFEAA